MGALSPEQGKRQGRGGVACFEGKSWLLMIVRASESCARILAGELSIRLMISDLICSFSPSGTAALASPLSWSTWGFCMDRISTIEGHGILATTQARLRLTQWYLR